TLESQEFDLVVTPSGGAAEPHTKLSLQPNHPSYVLFAVQSDLIDVLEPLAPPTTAGYPASLANVTTAPAQTTPGADDTPATLTAAHYQQGFDALRKIDEVSILSAPDGAAHPDWISIQKAMIQHCKDLADRFAVLDAHL